MDLTSEEFHYVDKKDADIGPIGVNEMKKAYENKTLDDEAFVWHPDFIPDWTPLNKVPELFKALKPPVVSAEPKKLPPPPAPRPISTIPPPATASSTGSSNTASSVSSSAPSSGSASVKAQAAAFTTGPFAPKIGVNSNLGTANNNTATSAPVVANRPAIGSNIAAAQGQLKPVIASRPGIGGAVPPTTSSTTVNNNNNVSTSRPAIAPRPAVAAVPGASDKPVPLPRSDNVRAAAAASAARRSGNFDGVAQKPAVPAKQAVAPAQPGTRLGKLGLKQVGDWVEHSTADGVAYYHNISTNELTWDKPDAMKQSSELANEQGEWVWIPDERDAYKPGKLISKKADGTIEVVLENGDKRSLKKTANVFPLMKSSLAKTEQDLVLLDNLDEGLILHNLRMRFVEQRQIYTNIGNILVSINPYETYSIYDIESIYKYKQRGNRVLDPHVFAIADEALSPLLEYGENHSILISGESVAGKTWNTKQCLAYLTEVTSKSSAPSGSTSTKGIGSSAGMINIESRILAANPILESFGNAKTVRNDNSSRFGRFTEVHFDKKDRKIQGARIDNFLLEKSRVVYQQADERNYHIFYQICRTPEWSNKYGIKTEKDFNYLNKSGCYDVSEVDDAQDFQSVLQAFNKMGLSDEEVAWVLELTAGVLHIGNITFVSDGGEGSKLSEKAKSTMDWVSKLLYVSSDLLMNGFTHRSIEVRGEITKIPLRPDDAESSRDALAKSIYGQLFDWLISRVNVALNGQSKPWALIGLLDIFGFEIFKVNSFEQLCINFTNEKLQQLFNRDTFQREQQIYKNEGVKFDEIKFIDNQPILDMIEKGPVGLLLMLDDMNRMPKSSDEGFVQKADSNHGSNKHYGTTSMTRQGKSCFTIKHYAGDVVYDANGFLVKNKDLLFADLYDAMSTSKKRETAAMFPPLSANERSKYSLGAQFRQQLDRLMNVLNNTQTHYIRCIKPNTTKAPKEMDPVLTLEQLRYSGVFEAVRIRKQGYPFRYTYERFVERYKCVMLRDAKWVPLKTKDPRDQVKEILDSTKQDFSDLQKGATMCLYRAHTHRLLELLRALALEKVCALIQAIVRGSIARTFVRRCKSVEPRLKKAVESRDVAQLDKALADYARIVGEYATMVPCDLAIVRKAKRLRYALMEWERLATDMDKLVNSKDVSKDDTAFEELRMLVWKAEELLDEPSGEWHMSMFKYCSELFDSERFARMDPKLREALDLLEPDLLTDVYAECERLKLEDNRLREIEKFMKMGKEDLLKNQYKRAKALHMQDRAREKEIKIREMFLDSHGDMFPFERFPRLREPEEFASATYAFWKREELAASMLRWTQSQIKTSLTQLEQENAKLAVKIHRAILGYCGDRPNPTPDNLAYEILNNGINIKELRDEIYCQIMKQLSGNDEHPQSRTRAWKLLSLCLQTFPPSNDLENYLQIFIRRNAIGDLKERLRDLLYEREYAGAVQQPPEISEISRMASKW